MNADEELALTKGEMTVIQCNVFTDAMMKSGKLLSGLVLLLLLVLVSPTWAAPAVEGTPTIVRAVSATRLPGSGPYQVADARLVVTVSV